MLKRNISVKNMLSMFQKYYSIYSYFLCSEIHAQTQDKNQTSRCLPKSHYLIEELDRDTQPNV